MDNNNTPNQVGEPQNSSTLINYSCLPLPGLGKILEQEYNNANELTEEYIIDCFRKIMEKAPKDATYINNQGYITRIYHFESEPE